MKYIVFAVVGVIIVIGVIVYSYGNYLDWLNAVKHETDRWAVIEDVNRDVMAVEPTSDNVWSELVLLHQSDNRMFVGGALGRYSNKWGFRFKPDNIIVAEVTVEGLQATIKHISTELDYWLDLGLAYVSCRVIQVHEL